MVSISKYGDVDVKACKAVLLEIVHLLGEIRDNMVLIGGWTPSFIIPQGEEPHIGSLDIDLALNFEKISDDTYKTILEVLREPNSS